MRVFRSYWTLPKEALYAVAAIGNFDGVHRGHKALIEEVRAAAGRLGSPAAVITFEPHPREVLQPEKAPKRLTPFRIKAGLLQDLGLDLLFALPFTPTLRAKTPDAFVHDVLAGGLGVRHVVVGYDFRFGYRAAGDAATLDALGREYGFGVTCLEAVAFEREVCSSTRIRDALAAGEVGRARELMGHPFVLEGRVVPGARRGRELGYPTANLRLLGRNPLIPPAGVYAVRAGLRRAGGIEVRDAVASLGFRPTFDGEGFLIEVHLFDTREDLYGERLSCAFIERLRGEERFTSAVALVRQMDRDSQQARAVLAACPA
ncbi:MAG TPA: bifunctional riboflavin kinase/FAD synthetase [Geminicoccaceae bacterium]